MNVFDSYIEAGHKLKLSERKDFYCALVEYLYYGTEPDGLKGGADAVWTAVFPSLKVSRAKAESGRKGGSKSPSKPASKTPSKQASESEAIKNTLTNTLTKPLEGGVGGDLSIAKEVVAYLNAKTGKAFKANSGSTTRKIAARVAEGYTLEDFKRVIDNKVSDWASDGNMAKYLRPETLFGNKFDGYLNEGRSNGEARCGDFDGLW